MGIFYFWSGKELPCLLMESTQPHPWRYQRHTIPGWSRITGFLALSDRELSGSVQPGEARNWLSERGMKGSPKKRSTFENAFLACFSLLVSAITITMLMKITTVTVKSIISDFYSWFRIGKSILFVSLEVRLSNVKGWSNLLLNKSRNCTETSKIMSANLYHMPNWWI